MPLLKLDFSFHLECPLLPLSLSLQHTEQTSPPFWDFSSATLPGSPLATLTPSSTRKSPAARLTTSSHCGHYHVFSRWTGTCGMPDWACAQQQCTAFKKLNHVQEGPSCPTSEPGSPAARAGLAPDSNLCEPRPRVVRPPAALRHQQ